MPKNPHPPRSSGSSKKQKEKDVTLTPSKDPDSKPSGKNKGKNKQEEILPPPDDGPKKPTTRELLAGSSWTGKLPINLFSEHCQKAKWEKPEYTMRRIPAGFISSVILRNKNQKTGEVTQLEPIRLPKSHEHLAVRETAVEARNVAATWALFRVASGKNLHMTLPNQFKDLWKGPFAEIKRGEQGEGKEWLYAENPFQAQKEREADLAKITKQREEANKERAKREEARASGDLLGASSGDPMRGWKTAPRVDIGRKLRREVEALVIREGAWNMNKTSISTAAESRLIDELTRLSFRRSHVEEAVEICKDREEALEWLLVHVPEDDLPKWALPEGYTAGVTMAGDARRDAMIKRLSASGYSQDASADALDECAGHEVKASCLLQDCLLLVSDHESINRQVANLNVVDNPHEPSDAWVEEQELLNSIYGDRYTKISEQACSVKLESKIEAKEITVCMLCGRSQYPDTLPVLQIQGLFPSYLKLSATRKALEHAAREFLGAPMIYNITDWLEQDIQVIFDKPGRLGSIASANIGKPPGSLSDKHPNPKRAHRQPQPLEPGPGSLISQQILQDWRSRQDSVAQQKMLGFRKTLPAWNKQNEIVSVVTNHQVTIISGATGSGKSTQAVQFVLDDLIRQNLGAATKIVCTQPRRISALGLADRVSDERCSKVGEEVGYTIRGESRQSKTTRISFCTTGVLLRRLQTSGGDKNDIVKSLADTSHIFVDEVHERSLDTDFLLALLKDVIALRKDLRIILMSATLDANVFERYFGGPKVVGKVEIEGRTFPVDDYYLDDIIQMTGFSNQSQSVEGSYSSKGSAPFKAIQSLGFGINYELIASLVHQIDEELGLDSGGILIFLPGTVEITRTIEALRSLASVHALPLHASLLPAEQRRVFPPPPKGKRKVIAATNVAETSITIPDIVAVIDCGKVKETQYDPQSSVVKLVEVWASKAACQQRRGRAGRVRPGNNYKLFTRQAEAERMPDKPEPEIRRTPLEQLCLSVKAMGAHDVTDFLANTITPPESTAVEEALKLLRRMGALDDNILTALGRHMAMIPADLRCAKLMILGTLFGCFDACLAVASILTVRSPFVSPQDKREEANAARATFSKGQSFGDLITDLQAFDEWQSQVRDKRPYKETRTWCEKNFLSNQTLQDISSTQQQYLSSLQETGFLPPRHTLLQDSTRSINTNSSSLRLLSAIILAALSPQTVRILYPPTKYTATSSGNLPLDPTAKSIQFFDEKNERVFIHPSSTLFSAQGYPGNPGFMSYWSKVATSKVFVRDLCPAGTFAVLLFGGSGIEVDKLGRGVVVDGWMRVRGWARIGVLVGRLRKIIDAKLQTWFESPDEVANEAQQDIVSLVKRLVELDGLDQ